MIKHYAILSGHLDDEGNMVYELEHKMVHNYLHAVAFDTDTDEWITPSRLDFYDDAENGDVAFLKGIVDALIKEQDDW
jgi:hypothetical protein